MSPQPILGPYATTGQLDDFLYELQQRSFVMDESFEHLNLTDNFHALNDLDLVDRCYTTYQHRVPEQFQTSDAVPKMEALRILVNDFLDHPYDGDDGSNEETEVFNLITRFGIRSRAFDLCLASMFLDYAVKDHLLKREEKDGQTYFSLTTPEEVN
ncbi:hypothetical protein HQ489_04685 [Candidatus Woesearchaeota archaeon]|nr:hypothetical protein [Candidatus Woesearchaeota archaeon]